MSINIDQWHARIGSFIQKIDSVRYLNITSCKVILFFCIPLLTHGDIESNSGPTKNI